MQKLRKKQTTDSEKRFPQHLPYMGHILFMHKPRHNFEVARGTLKFVLIVQGLAALSPEHVVEKASLSKCLQRTF